MPGPLAQPPTPFATPVCTRRADFEVDFHLKVLEDAAAAQAGAGTGTAGGQAAAAGATAKNRRLAAMNRLLVEGSYFSEKEMRERQPGMYHQYVGQYRPPEQPQGAYRADAALMLGRAGTSQVQPQKQQHFLLHFGLPLACPLMQAMPACLFLCRLVQVARKGARRAASWLTASCGSRRSWACGSGRRRSSGSGTG
jgi:hypothetical protein